MIRGLFALASILSLLLGAATLLLWARSHGTNDGFDQIGRDRSRSLCSASGRIMYFERDDSAMTASGFWPPGETMPPPWRYEAVSDPARPNAGDETWLNRLGIAIEWREQVPITDAFSTRPIFATNTRVILPHWLLALAFALLPALWLTMTIRRRAARSRAAHGRCVACGYDLRAGHDRCPECGTTTNPTSQAAR